MAVKVLISRRLQEGRSKAAYTMLNDLRAGAMKQPGYITGETLLSYDNPRRMTVLSTWQSLKNWEAWKENPDRKAIEANLARLLDGPTEYEAFVMGTHPAA